MCSTGYPRCSATSHKSDVAMELSSSFFGMSLVAMFFFQHVFDSATRRSIIRPLRAARFS